MIPTGFSTATDSHDKIPVRIARNRQEDFTTGKLSNFCSHFLLLNLPVASVDGNRRGILAADGQEHYFLRKGMVGPCLWPEWVLIEPSIRD